MHKKLMMACMAIAAFAAFVIAPTASASPVLTSGGVKVPTGTSITTKNTGNTLFSGGFNVTCTTADLKGTVTENSGTTINVEVPVGSASFTGTGAGGACTSALGEVHLKVVSKICFRLSFSSDGVSFVNCGEFTFTLKVTHAEVTCAYSTSGMTGTYVTNASATVNLNAQPASREGSNIFCPSTGTLTMDFDLYTTNGTLLTIS